MTDYNFFLRDKLVRGILSFPINFQYHNWQIKAAQIWKWSERKIPIKSPHLFFLSKIYILKQKDKKGKLYWEKGCYPTAFPQWLTVYSPKNWRKGEENVRVDCIKSVRRIKESRNHIYLYISQLINQKHVLSQVRCFVETAYGTIPLYSIFSYLTCCLVAFN